MNRLPVLRALYHCVLWSSSLLAVVALRQRLRRGAAAFPLRVVGLVKQRWLPLRVEVAIVVALCSSAAVLEPLELGTSPTGSLSTMGSSESRPLQVAREQQRCLETTIAPVT